MTEFELLISSWVCSQISLHIQCSLCSAYPFLISAFSYVKIPFLVREVIDILGCVLIALYKDGIM